MSRVGAPATHVLSYVKQPGHPKRTYVPLKPAPRFVEPSDLCTEQQHLKKGLIG